MTTHIPHDPRKPIAEYIAEKLLNSKTKEWKILRNMTDRNRQRFINNVFQKCTP